MQSYTELTPPTAVTHSLSLPFLSSSANNLIVAKTSLLQIFSFKSIVTEIGESFNDSHVLNANQSRSEAEFSSQSAIQTSHSNVPRNERVHTTKLVLIAQYQLSGTVTSIARVKILRSKSGGEAILVSLRDAKLSLIEWDPERYSISTISIHYYEREDLQGSPWEPDLAQCINYLSVDPSSRCAALKFGARHIAILPFHQAGDDLVMDDYDPDLDYKQPDSATSARRASTTSISREKTPYAASFVLSLLALDPTLSHPLHLAFLHEYREPTFGILSSQVAISTALLHDRRDTVSYTVFTLDLEQRASTTLLSVSDLPYDLFAVMPLSLPVGGALLVGANELIHIDQAGKANGTAVNGFAKLSTSLALIDQSDLGLKLEHCVIEQLGPDNRELLMILGTGELAVIIFKTDGRSVSGLSVRHVSDENGGAITLAGASCATVIGRGRIFVGSEAADSIILGWARKSDRFKRHRSRTNMEIDGKDDVPDLDEDAIEDEDDDDDLYSGIKPEDEILDQAKSLSNTDPSNEYIFRVHDSMQNVGPMKDLALRNISNDRKSYNNSLKDFSSKLELVISSGCGRAGGLVTFQRQIHPIIEEEYSISDAQDIWPVCTRLTAEGNNGNDTAIAKRYDNYIIASIITKTGKEFSRAYNLTTAGIEEVRGTDFDSEAGMTIEMGTLNNGTRIVQVLSAELRTFDAGKFGNLFSFPNVIALSIETKGEASRRKKHIIELCCCFISWNKVCFLDFDRISGGFWPSRVVNVYGLVQFSSGLVASMKQLYLHVHIHRV